jgi:NAD(P)-dependent dehydrogenase (short-subunit alcohol dehydrogenase family)
VDGFLNKIAVITGGASGIGRALAELLAKGGADVVLADLNGPAAEEAAQAISASGGKARGATLDVRDPAAVKALIDETVARAGRIDYLFNNAGVITMGEARDITPDDWRTILDVNLYGVVHGVQAAYPIMVRQGSGHIVNTASMAGLMPNAFQIPYATSKYAVFGLSTSLRLEGADLGVRVSVVCPGFIDTPILQSRMVKMNRDAYWKAVPTRPMPAATCARLILDGVRRNRGVITIAWYACFFWWLDRLFPGLMHALTRVSVRRMRRLLRE